MADRNRYPMGRWTGDSLGIEAHSAPADVLRSAGSSPMRMPRGSLMLGSSGSSAKVTGKFVGTGRTPSRERGAIEMPMLSHAEK